MKKISIFLSFPFISGVFIIIFIILHSKTGISMPVEISLFFVLIVASVFFSIILKQYHMIAGALVFSVLLTFVICRLMAQTHDYDSSLTYFEKTASFLGYISEFPLKKNDRIDFEFTVCGIKPENGPDFEKKKPFRILIRTVMKDERFFTKGDSLIITGKIRIPPEKIGTFDYKNYLLNQEIFGTIMTDSGKIRSLSGARVEPFVYGCLKNHVWSIKEKICSLLEKNLTHESYAFFLSIFFGIRSQICDEVYAEFQNTGMLHLLAISGMNISFIGGIFLFVFRIFLSKSKAYFFSLAFLFLYVVSIYYSSSGMRAYVMYALCAFYFVSGRRTTAFSILSVSAIIMILANPFCIFDTGFQLSFFATAGIILFSGMIEEYLPFWFHPKLKSVISVTVSAYISVVFLQWSLFGKIQLIAILSSIIIVPIFEFLFVYWFFMIIIFYLSSLNFIGSFIEIPAVFFLKMIHILNSISPLELPAIPYFIQFLIFPALYLIFYHLLPYASKLLQKTKKTSLIIDFERKIT
jgi:competence protein ComEC